MSLPSWQIGSALGIPIRIHASWFVVFALVTWVLATGYLPDNLPGLSPGRYWAMGGMAAVLLFLSVLLHELGHSYVALRYRVPIDRITLFIFGGVAHMRKEAPTPGRREREPRPSRPARWWLSIDSTFWNHSSLGAALW